MNESIWSGSDAFKGDDGVGRQAQFSMSMHEGSWGYMSFLASEGACRHTKILTSLKGRWVGGSEQALLTTVGGRVSELGWSQK